MVTHLWYHLRSTGPSQLHFISQWALLTLWRSVQGFLWSQWKKPIRRWSFTLDMKKNPTSHFYFQLKRAQEYCSKEKKNQTINPVTWKHQEDWGHTEYWEGVEFEKVSVIWEGSKSRHYIGKGTAWKASVSLLFLCPPHPSHMGTWSLLARGHPHTPILTILAVLWIGYNVSCMPLQVSSSFITWQDLFLFSFWDDFAKLSG